MNSTVITINGTDADHLALVISEMQVLGAPVIRCVRDDAQGVVLALEGSHRLTAAHHLGLTPKFVFLGEDDMITCDDIGYDDCGWFEGEPARVADIRDRIGGGDYSQCGAWLKF